MNQPAVRFGGNRTARLLTIDTAQGDKTLQARLFQELRRLISERALAPGSRLPSSRRLAADLGISRTTVVAVLEKLASDGWVQMRHGSGTYVAQQIPEALAGNMGLEPPERSAQAPFSVGVPGLDLFPLHVWNRLQARRWRQMPRSALEEGDSAGWAGLRWSIAAHLRLTRNIACDPQQVIITTGARASIFLAARVLGRAGDAAWVEDPGYFGSAEALRAAGMRPVPVPVDGQGLCIGQGEKLAPDARLALVTPHRHFPTGAQLSPGRRDQLLAWARRSGACIIDNGYDCEIRLGGDGGASLASSGDPSVVYVNSFNKILFPALRIGYVVAPAHLVDLFVEARRAAEGHANVPNQMVLRDFLEEGHFDEHVRICREAYEERARELVATVDERLAPWLRLCGPPRGLHLIAEVVAGFSALELVEAARSAGIDLTPMSQLRERPGGEQQVLLGFAGFGSSTLRSAAQRLSRVCEQLSKR